MPPETIPSLFLDAARTFDKRDAFLRRIGGRYRDVSHREMLAFVRNVACGLLDLGLVKGDRVALLSENRLEWVISDLAILSAGCVNVPIFSTLPSNQIEYIFTDSEVRAAFVSDATQFEKIRPLLGRLRHVQHVFSFDAVPGADEVATLDELMKRGEAAGNPSAFDDRVSAIGRNDCASVIYTSGTTGDPKGAVLTHGNFVSNVKSCTETFYIDSGDRCLSLCPLSHALERTAGYYAPLHRGATIAYAENFNTVAENAREVRPTFIVVVPRFLEKVHAGIAEKVAKGSAFERGLFSWAVRVGGRYVEQKAVRRVSSITRIERGVARVIVFNKMMRRLGGRLRFCISGGAPLSREISEFFFAIGLPVLEGYGTTEASPVLSVNTLGAFKIGTVGKPLKGVEIRIADDGEILARGPNIMQGYLKKPELTDEVLREGWYHTGDVGHIDPHGFVVITDRKKDLIVTSGGKKVAPQPIEQALRTSAYVSEALIVGDQRRFVSAIIVPNFDRLRAFADAAGISYSSDADLVREPRVIKKMSEEISSKTGHLAGFERIRKFILREKSFSLEDGELTPTLKVKRRVIERKLQREIDSLYTE
jgi:long-chain acyl-CoA synthetase